MSLMGPPLYHMSQYGRLGKKLRIGNNIKKLIAGFLELWECEGKGGR
jgi:hypothetical protein